MKHKLVKMLMRLGLAVGLGVVWLRLVEVERMVELIRLMEWRWLGWSLAVLGLSLVLSVVRLQLLLGVEVKAGFRYLLKLNVIGQAASVVAPANAGGFLRGYLLKKKFKRSFSIMFGVVLVDFLMSVGVSLVVGLLALGWFLQQLVWVGLAGLVLVLGVGLMLSPELVKKWWRFKAGKQQVDDLVRVLVKLKQAPMRLMAAGMVSGLILLSLGLMMWLVVRGLGGEVSVWRLVLAHSVVGLVSLVPGIPAKIGQYELAGLMALSGLVGLDVSLAGTATVLTHMLMVSVSMGLGMIVGINRKLVG